MRISLTERSFGILAKVQRRFCMCQFMTAGLDFGQMRRHEPARSQMLYENFTKPDDKPCN